MPTLRENMERGGTIMATARKCDRCGCFYEPYSIWSGGSERASRSGKPSSIIFTLTDENNTKYCVSAYSDIPETGTRTKDLCSECMDELLAWWKRGANND